MEPREVSCRRYRHLSSGETRDAISSLNEAWLHTLDEYVIDTPLSQVILPVMRACFFGGATYTGLINCRPVRARDRNTGIEGAQFGRAANSKRHNRSRRSRQ